MPHAMRMDAKDVAVRGRLDPIGTVIHDRMDLMGMRLDTRAA